LVCCEPNRLLPHKIENWSPILGASLNLLELIQDLTSWPKRSGFPEIDCP
jgi:hypothetical protein